MKFLHLVAYDYGQGAIWAVVLAESADHIKTEFPELTIVTHRPQWMNDQELDKIMGVHTYDISDRAVGLLAEIIDARHKNEG